MLTRSNFKIYSTSKQAWDAMYLAILDAQKSIYWELFIFLDDEAGKPFFDVLEKKAIDGLNVKLIIDYWGSFNLSRKRIVSLKKAGVDVKFFSEKKLRYRGWWKRFITPSHRKILITDEEVGFIGGVNIQKEMEKWWDIQIKIVGKVVRSLLRSFAKQYIICGGDRNEVVHLLKYRFKIKNDGLSFIYGEANDKNSKMGNKYIQALLMAREKVIMFSPYCFPDKKLILALLKVRRRGVKIDLVIPYPSDFIFADYATYGWFSILKKMGVVVHLMSEMMHGKGMLIDDNMAIVGSSNLNQSSFYDNYEANVQINDKDLIKNLKDIVDGWISNAKKIDDYIFQRSFWRKIKEKVAFKLYKIWHGNR